MSALSHALRYAELGWHVLPVEPHGKRPMNGCGIDHATTDSAQIERWFADYPDANVGIRLDTSGLVAVDIDPRNGGAVELIDELPFTLTAKTGGDGRHLIYRAAASAKFTGQLRPGVDLKHHGYIVVEPSVHPSGAGYSWMDWEVGEGAPEIADAPPELLRPSDEPRANAASGAVREGGRNEHLSRAAFRLRKAGCSIEGIEAELLRINAADCSPPLDEAEVRAIARGKKRIEADAEPASPGDPLAALARFVVTEDQVKDMQSTRLIWRDLIAQGHVAVWSAPPNAGKTALACLAASELAADGFNVLFFQEDAGAADLPRLHLHAQEHGYRLLNSTLANAVPEDQIDVLRALVDSGSDLSDLVMFFDTLKKYLDLMSKRSSREFFQLMRALTQRGATIVLLGHTNKHRGVDGKLMFEGVGDVRSDVDELLYIEHTDRDPVGIVMLTVSPDKVRCQIRETTFKLDTNTMIVTAAKEVVDVGALRRRCEHMEEDREVIAAVTEALRPGGMPIFKLIAKVVADSDFGDRTVRAVVNRYVGTAPADPNALWIETYIRMNNTRHIGLKPGANVAP